MSMNPVQRKLPQVAIAIEAELICSKFAVPQVSPVQPFTYAASRYQILNLVCDACQDCLKISQIR